jgi:hypothetical protein
VQVPQRRQGAWRRALNHGAASRGERFDHEDWELIGDKKGLSNCENSASNSMLLSTQIKQGIECTVTET